jgi:hypothetical protein
MLHGKSGDFGHTMDKETVAALESARIGKSLRTLARDLGFGDSFAATLSHIFNGRTEHVSRKTEKRIRRALGLEPPPRKLFRPVCTKEEWQEFQEWKKASSSPQTAE